MRCWCRARLPVEPKSVSAEKTPGHGVGSGRGEEHAPGRQANLRVLTLHDAPLDVGLEKLRLRLVLQLFLLEQGSQATV